MTGDQNITCNLPPGEYTLICSDSWGDGWNGGHVTIQGVKYCENFNQGSQMLAQVNIISGWVMPVNDNVNNGKRR